MRATMIRTLVVSILAILSVSATPIKRGPTHRIAVVDTGLDLDSEEFKPYLCPTGHRDFTGLGIQDDDGHGSEVTGLIISNARGSDFCIVVYKFFSNRARLSWNSALLGALREINRQRFEVANLSLSGEGFLQDEYSEFKANQFTTFVTAAGNDGVSLDEDPRYPASYGFKNIIVVGALNKFTGKKRELSNYGSIVKNWEKAEATSFATAITTGKIIKARFGKTHYAN